MDKNSLRRTLQCMEKKLEQLSEILEDHEERCEEDPGVAFDPRPCLSLVQDLLNDIDEECEIAAGK